MCGEVFSSRIPESVKARVDQPHPLARPGRWSVVFSLDGESGVKASRERSFIDRDADLQDRGEGGGLGFSSEAAAQAAIARHDAVSRYHFVIPPAESYGDHDASRLSHEQLVALGNAILNNNSAGYEALRQEYADLTRGSAPDAPPLPTRSEYVQKKFATRSAAAEAIVAFLTDTDGGYGNGHGFVDLDDAEGDSDAELGIANYGDSFAVSYVVPDAEVSDADDHYGSLDLLRDLVRAYQSAED